METIIHFFQHFFALCGAHSLTHPTIFVVAIIAFGIYFSYKSLNTDSVTE